MAIKMGGDMAAREMTFSELKRKSFCNSADLTKVIVGDKLLCWHGIGWVEEGEATDEDRENYPTVVEG